MEICICQGIQREKQVKHNSSGSMGTFNSLYPVRFHTMLSLVVIHIGTSGCPSGLDPGIALLIKSKSSGI